MQNDSTPPISRPGADSLFSYADSADAVRFNDAKTDYLKHIRYESMLA